MHGYDHRAIERKWQERWEKEKLYETSHVPAGKKKYYLLTEFPYPSGNLHIGHWYAFAVPDIFARFQRMRGYHVLYPIGFDAFGLPAENAAIKHGRHPRDWTYDNIARMTAQLKSMGNMFDWSRQVITSDQEFYRWTQWLFLRLFEAGLAYRATELANWCPSCKTVLANEQVKDGACERCGTEVGKREQASWFLRITAYADRLIDDLDNLPWPEEIKESQRNWIGRRRGAELPFALVNEQNPEAPVRTVRAFTTRADTLFGATYLVIAPEHSLVQELMPLVHNKEEVQEYVHAACAMREIDRLAEDREKTGVILRGVAARHPLTGKMLPVLLADYVLAHYGTGVVMGVPAHDARDYLFARGRGLPVVPVVVPERLFREKGARGADEMPLPYTGEGVLINSARYDGMPSQEARRAIVHDAEGQARTTYRLRDWSLSRQRYWGCPIPIVYDPEGTPHAVPDEHLPWTLPEDVDFTPSGKSPLASSKELRERTERLFGKGWKPEVDTFDTFVDSSWYYLRYADPHNAAAFADARLLADWLPVDRYSGGAEHTTMHLLYSRFWHKALYDLKLVPTPEPYIERFNHGQILGPDGKKMSKSRGNVVDPDEHVARVGADAVKLYLAFMGPYHTPANYPFDLGGIAGMRRFLERVVRLSEKQRTDTAPPRDLARLLHQTIRKVTEDIPAFKFNTAISALMVLLNRVDKETVLATQVYETFLRLLAPFAPHLAEELWERCGHTTSIHLQAWPEWDAQLVQEEEVTIVVQIDGKTRATFAAPRGLSREDVVQRAREVPHIASRLEGRAVRTTVVVPDRLVNFVTAPPHT